MKMTPLSFVLVTAGRQPLIRFSLTSLMDQLTEADEFLVSINSLNPGQIAQTVEIIEAVDLNRRIKIIHPASPLSVYEHYRFGISSASHEHVVIVHDDDIYNPGLAGELRKGFSDPAVTVVVGGLLRVDLHGDVARPAVHAAFENSIFTDGTGWLRRNKGLYPHFCYSAVSLYRPALDLSIFSATATAADCLAVAQLALAGKVYQSELIFATWLQLAGRTSRWSLIKPGAVTPHLEFAEYYKKLGNMEMAARAISFEQDSLAAFTRKLFAVALANNNPSQIATCLQKIREINPGMARRLGWVQWPPAARVLSVPCRLLVRTKHAIMRRKAMKAGSDEVNAIARLGVNREFWDHWIRAVLAACSSVSG